MKTITLAEAIGLLAKAFGIDVLDADHNQETDFHLTTEEDDLFLRLEAEDDEGQTWVYEFYKDDNETVKVDGERMTLVYDTDVKDGLAPVVDIRILTPLPVEPGPLGTVPMPPLVRKAMDHVRTFHPDVDRVVFWNDGRWAYMNDGHEIRQFDIRIDQGILEDAGDEVANLSPCAPIAFQLRDDELNQEEPLP